LIKRGIPLTFFQGVVEGIQRENGEGWEEKQVKVMKDER
jgi:hypothetical protein